MDSKNKRRKIILRYKQGKPLQTSRQSEFFEWAGAARARRLRGKGRGRRVWVVVEGMEWEGEGEDGQVERRGPGVGGGRTDRMGGRRESIGKKKETRKGVGEEGLMRYGRNEGLG